MYLSRTSVRTAQQRSGAHIITERKQKWRKEGVPNPTAQVTHPPVIYFLQLGLTSWSFQNFTKHAIIRSTINHMSLWIFLIFRLKQLLQIYVLYLRHTALSLQLFSKHLVFFFLLLHTEPYTFSFWPHGFSVDVSLLCVNYQRTFNSISEQFLASYCTCLSLHKAPPINICFHRYTLGLSSFASSITFLISPSIWGSSAIFSVLGVLLYFRF